MEREPAIIVIVFHISIYGYYSIKYSGAGTIEVKKGRKSLFMGDNGIKLFVNKWESDGLTKISNVVKTYSDKDDCLLCFPYCPGINFMTNRKTYMKSFYFDDFMVSKNNSWQIKTIKKIKERKPAIFMFSDMAINTTEISRFSNWASKVKEYIEENYSYYGEIMGFFIYIHPDAISLTK